MRGAEGRRGDFNAMARGRNGFLTQRRKGAEERREVSNAMAQGRKDAMGRNFAD